MKNVEDASCPGAGSCGGLYTANTMACMSEALGLALPGSATPPAVDGRRSQFVFETGRVVMKALEDDLKPRDILTFEALRTQSAYYRQSAVLQTLSCTSSRSVENRA